MRKVSDGASGCDAPAANEGDFDVNPEADGGDAAGERDTQGGGDGFTYPSEALDLTNWKLTLPIGAPGDPVEISQPELATYSLAPYFELSESGEAAVVFRAHAGGVTTSGSQFPRSELREMSERGSIKANWSTTSGVHTMTITQAITHLPDVAPNVVAGQIHGGNEYVVLVRLDGSYLWVKSGGVDVGALDRDYTLGEEFTLRLTAANGQIDVYYNDLTTPAVSLPYVTTGCYFKAGSYAQSNTDRGELPEAYAEVRIRDLVITHE